MFFLRNNDVIVSGRNQGTKEPRDGSAPLWLPYRGIEYHNAGQVVGIHIELLREGSPLLSIKVPKVVGFLDLFRQCGVRSCQRVQRLHKSVQEVRQGGTDQRRRRRVT